MSILRYAHTHVTLFVLVLVFAAPAIAQDGMRSSLRASEAYAEDLGTQSLPQGFRAPDRSLPEYRSVQATFTVTTTADSGPGSLRAAMDAANASPGLDAIAFDINGGGTYEEIEVLSLLPYLTDPVTIDGDTQGCDTTEGLCIRLDGHALGPFSESYPLNGGLVVLGGGSTIHGLLFTRFFRDSFFFSAPALRICSDDNTVTGCYFGTDRTGMITDPDGIPDSGDELGNAHGIFVNPIDHVGFASVNNTIGGTTAAERNVVAGSVGIGIGISWEGAYENVVVGNYVGTNARGTAALGNRVGISVFLANENTIQDNLVSGNIEDGISLRDGVSGNLVTGNFIGTDVTGILPVPNGSVGVPDTGFGIVIGSPSASTALAGNTIGGASFADANVIGFNLSSGILVTGGGAMENVIDHNYIGVTADGSPIPNGLYGVLFRSSLCCSPMGNRVGSLTATSPPSGNVIGYQPIGIALSAFKADEFRRDNEVAFNEFVGAPDAFLPIDLSLDGPTANDAGDPDDGPNRLQNTPVVESASVTASGDELTVTFRVDTAPANAAYPLTVRFFHRSVDGGIERYVGIGEVSYAESDAQQSVTATLTLPAVLPPGEMGEIVATATDADGDTGEVSPVGVTVANEQTAGLPGTHALSTAYPNPFNPSAQFTLTVAEHQHVVIELYDTLGRRVAVLLDEPVAGGTTRSVRIDGQGLASGTYVVRVAGERFQDRLRVTVLK